ncbi:MAG: DUF72 domain-containing protein [Candidatus Eremiobacteraeota bacterium]|nr:DUF72 domain-containing protein [Candidatus Eremiobacteraeota bacterium]
MRWDLGTQGWSYDDWAGTMYDAAERPENYLRSYAQEFRSVEIDSTFYGTPAVDRVRKWAAAVPDGFTFSCKLSREITHERRTIGANGLIAEFYDAMRAFGPKLGCVLVQFEASYTRAEEPDFRSALQAFPRDVRTAFEFRDPAWYAPDVQALLDGRAPARAIVDAPFVPRETMRETLRRTTVNFAYLRFIGDHDAFARFDRVGLSREREIAWWAAAIRDAMPRLERVFGYVNNHYQGHSPATVRALHEALGVPHERPRRIVQPTLF